MKFQPIQMYLFIYSHIYRQVKQTFNTTHIVLALEKNSLTDVKKAI